MSKKTRLKDKGIKPAGISSGRFTTPEHDEPDTALVVPTNPLLPGIDAAARGEAIQRAAYVPPVATIATHAPETTDDVESWWGSHFAAAEYQGADGSGGYPQMADDETPGMTGGKALSGHRRTHRMRYSGAGVDLRMPSAAAIKRASASIGGTFDVPVEATYNGGSVKGWVRVTESAGGNWVASGLGFDKEANQNVAEAVAAVLEARRPSVALRQYSDMVHRVRDRALANGVETIPVESSFIDRIGYVESAGVVAVVIGNRKYGYEAPREVAEKLRAAAAPGVVYNALVKGSHRVSIDVCDRCSRFYRSTTQHRCPDGHRTAPRAQQTHNKAARKAAKSWV